MKRCMPIANFKDWWKTNLQHFEPNNFVLIVPEYTKDKKKNMTMLSPRAEGKQSFGMQHSTQVTLSVSLPRSRSGVNVERAIEDLYFVLGTGRTLLIPAKKKSRKTSWKTVNGNFIGLDLWGDSRHSIELQGFYNSELAMLCAYADDQHNTRGLALPPHKYLEMPNPRQLAAYEKGQQAAASSPQEGANKILPSQQAAVSASTSRWNCCLWLGSCLGCGCTGEEEMEERLLGEGDSNPGMTSRRPGR